MKSLVKLFTATICLFLISACGGGGGGGGGAAGSTSNPTDTNIVFSLFPSGYFTEGHTESYILNGSDTAGGTQTGSYSLQTKAQTTFNGTPAIPFAITLQMTNTQTGAFISSTGTGYYSTDTNDLRNLGFTSTTFGTTTASAVTQPIPTTAKIGDFGDVGTYIDSAGEKDISSWRLIDGYNGRAKLILSTSTFDQTDTLINTSETTYLIEENGNQISINFRVYYLDLGVTLTLSGNKT